MKVTFELKSVSQAQGMYLCILLPIYLKGFAIFEYDRYADEIFVDNNANKLPE